MGTLTADCPRLAEHCPHKLPSSCRLTSTPLCCACADIRPHSSTYRVYIDGVGYVNRGTRWQSYCWFCKSFWDARVTAAGLLPPATRIPEDPDQAEFVERWFEWYQGYRVIKHDDGTEERVNLVGQPLKDADPGFLPWSADELERGQRTTLESDSNRRVRFTDVPAAPHVTLEDELDRLMEEIDDEESDDEASSPQVETSRNAPQAPTAVMSNVASNTESPNEARTRLDEAYADAQAAVDAAQRVRDRAEARLQNADSTLSELQERLRRIRRQQIALGNFTRVFGTREDVNSEDYVSPITSMFQRQAQWARMSPEERAARERAHVQNQQERERRERQQNWLEQMEANRAQEEGMAGFMHGVQQGREELYNLIPNTTHNRSAEIGSSEADQTQRSGLDTSLETVFQQVAHNAASSGPPTLPHITGISQEDAQLSNAIMQSLQSLYPSTPTTHPNQPNSADSEIPSIPSNSRPVSDEPPRLDMLVDTSRISTALREHLVSVGLLPAGNPNPPRSNYAGPPIVRFRTPHEPSFLGLDADGRPEPKSDAEMTAKIECLICLQQSAEVACLPCGHLAMCTWCADQWIPSKEGDKTRPRDKGVRCPCCRKSVKSRVRIFV